MLKVYKKKRATKITSSNKPTINKSNQTLEKFSKLDKNLNKKKPLGLCNFQLNCYMNSTIQCLFSMKEFRNYFLNEEFDKEEKPVSNELNIIFKKLTNDDKPFTLHKFKKMIGNIDDSFQGSNGADATDLLKTIISEIKNEQCNFYGLNISSMSILDESNEEAVFKDCKRQLGDDSAINKIVNFYRTKYECQTRKKHTSYLFEICSIIDFDLLEIFGNYNSKNVELEECFKYSFKSRYESNEYCYKCKIDRKCKCIKSIYQTSDYLIIILDYGKGKIFKGKVIFDEYINIRDYVENDKKNQIFRLIGAVIHHGTSSAYGHYISYCRSEDNKLYCFNDSIVTPTNFEELKKGSSPYILFYEKIFI